MTINNSWTYSCNMYSKVFSYSWDQTTREWPTPGSFLEVVPGGHSRRVYPWSRSSSTKWMFQGIGVTLLLYLQMIVWQPIRLEMSDAGKCCLKSYYTSINFMRFSISICTKIGKKHKWPGKRDSLPIAISSAHCRMCSKWRTFSGRCKNA